MRRPSIRVNLIFCCCAEALSLPSGLFEGARIDEFVNCLGPQSADCGAGASSSRI